MRSVNEMNRVLRARHPLLVPNARPPLISSLSQRYPHPRLSLFPNSQCLSSLLPNSFTVKHKNQPGISSLTTSATFCTANKGTRVATFTSPFTTLVYFFNFLINFFALDMATKKCVPCNTKDLQPMTEDAAHALIPQVY